jgi:hypothetical protein
LHDGDRRLGDLWKGEFGQVDDALEHLAKVVPAGFRGLGVRHECVLRMAHNGT